MSNETDRLIAEFVKAGGGSSGIAPERSTFEKLLIGLDKPDASVRSAIGRALGDSDAPRAKQVYKGEREYSARDLLNAVEDKYDVDLYFGDKEDADPSTLAKLGNFATEMATYVGISPSTALLSLPAKVAKKAMGITKATTAGQKLATRAATGAGIGALTGDDTEESLLNALTGAVTLGAGAPAVTKAGAAISKKIGEPLVDVVQRGLNPEAFRAIEKDGKKLGYSEAFKTAREAEGKYASVGREIRNMDSVLGFHKLGADDSKKLMDYLDSKHSMTHEYRNKLESDIIKKRAGVADTPDLGGAEAYQARRRSGQKFGDRYAVDRDGQVFIAKDGASQFAAHKGKVPKGAAKVSDLNSYEALSHGARDSKGNMLGGVLSVDELNKLTRQSNTYVGKLVDEELAKIGDVTLTNNVRKYVDRNRKIIDDYNKFNKKRYGDSFVETAPIDFHTMEIIPRDLMKGAMSFDDIKTGLVRRSSGEPIQSGGLTMQERLQRESEKFANAYLTEAEKEATRLVNAVRFDKSADVGAEQIKNVFKKYDQFTNFLKQQHLTFSHSWVVNNASDNLVKAYLSGGAKNAWQSALNTGKAIFRKNSDDMISDLMKITDPNGSHKIGTVFSDDMMKPALDSGALSEGFFTEAFSKGQISEAALTAKVGGEEAAKIMTDASSMTGAQKIYGKYSDFLASTVGRTGQLVEGAARATTFKNITKNIINNDAALRELGVSVGSKDLKNIVKKVGYTDAAKVVPDMKKVYDESARIVNETFFDYSNINAFEQKVLKRIFPYWTFFSRNVPYWMETLATKPAEVNKVFSAFRSIGRRPTEREREGIPDYLIDQGARIGSDGKIVTAPSISLLDALSVNPSDIRSSSLEKIHPLLKVSQQFITGTDDFGGELLPSNTKSGRKRVFGSGVKFAPFSSDIYRDGKSGKLYTDSDLMVALETMQKNLLPVPAIDTIAKMVEESKSKGTDLGTLLFNLSPVKQKDLSTSEQSSIRRYRKAAKRREDRNRRNAERVKR